MNSSINVGDTFGKLRVVATSKQNWEQFDRALHIWADMGEGWTPIKQKVWEKWACRELKLRELRYKNARDFG